MSANQPSVAAAEAPPEPAASFLRRRLPFVVAAAALVAGVAIGGGVALSKRHATPAVNDAAGRAAVATWAPGQRPAPGFGLADQRGRPFTLASLRGRPVIVTFIDPLCRNLCPLEARVISSAVASMPAAQRPAIVSVSVNPDGDDAATFRADAVRWRLGAGWRWGVASHTTLARVWRSYGIGVRVTSITHAGVTVHEVEHTEASYVLDAAGDERALLLYPFRTTDLVHVLRTVAAR
jgi:cytochrome oxidase Cu insertion factor (SCO1/SenC/PrrC family)